MDPFQNLTNIFECSPEYFFRFFSENSGEIHNNQLLRLAMIAMRDKIPVPDCDAMPAKANQFAIADAKFKKLPIPEGKDLIPDNYLSAFSAMYGLSKVIPDNSLLHLSILNSTRIMQMFSLPPHVAVYSNIGTDGIDGSMSTFLGQASAAKRPCFLVIGDLSFFYDMNSLGLRNIGSNVHILLINNGGGAEFYFSMGPQRLPNIDLHISAAHNHSAKDWVLSNHFRYLSAKNTEEFYSSLPKFMDPLAENPVVFEVFTDKANDIKILKAFRRAIHQDDVSPIVKVAHQVENLPGIKQMAQTDIGQNVRSKLKIGIKKLF